MNEEFAILEMLRAQGPHPDYRDKLQLFGQFVGTWDMQVMFYEDGKKLYDQAGVWSFSWVLDGRAIQDVLVYPNPEQGFKSTPGERRIGTTLRFYDPKLDKWRIIWLGPVTGDIGNMTGRSVGEEIWIEEKESDGSLTRWIFTEITPHSFRWKGMISSDLGKSWTLDQEMIALRHS